MAEQQLIISTEPKPLPKSDRCPTCNATRDKRRAGGFGSAGDVCGVCGHDYEERTL